MSFNKGIAWNLVGSGLPLLVGLATIPFLIKALGIERFGILTLIWALIGYFSLFDFGLSRALTQVISKHRQDQSTINAYATVGLFLICLLGLLGMLLLVVGVLVYPDEWLGVQQDMVTDTRQALIWCAVGIPMATLTAGCRGVLEGFLKFKESNILRLMLGIANFLFPVLAVVFIEPSLTYVAVSLVIARALILALSIAQVRRDVLMKHVFLFSGSSVYKEFGKFGSWLTVSNLVSPLMVVSDRFFLAAIAGTAVVAYYTVPFEIVIRALIIPAALTGVYFAYASNLNNSNALEAEKFYKAKRKQTIFLMLGIGASIVLFSKIFLTLWMGKEFAEQAWVIMALMGIGIALNGMAQMPLSAIHASGQTKVVAQIHLTEFILYIPLLYVLIERFGATGAAFAWIFRALIDLICMSYVERSIRRKSLRLSTQ